jgi:hypothetical protein
MQYKNWWQHPSLLQDLTKMIDLMQGVGYISDQTSAQLVDVLKNARSAIAGYSNMGKIPSGPKMAFTQLVDLTSMMQGMENLKVNYEITPDGVHKITIVQKPD